MEEKIKGLTESFARAEISREDYTRELNGTKKELDEVKAEILRLDKGATVPEVRKEEKPEAPKEEKPEEKKPKEQEELETVPDKEKPEQEPKPDEKEEEDKVVIHSKLQPEGGKDEK